jgi:hypothetical protein
MKTWPASGVTIFHADCQQFMRIKQFVMVGSVALRRPRPSAKRGRNEWPVMSAILNISQHNVRFRRLTLRSATGTAQRASPYHSVLSMT